MQDPPPELNRVGLARFRSAPASWLDALLEDDDPLKLPGQPHHQTSLTQLLTSSGPSTSPVHPGRPGNFIQPTTPDPGFYDHVAGASATATSTASFQRMNSSPADFLGGNIDGYFAGPGFPATSYDFSGGGGGGGGGSSADASPSGKRLREADFEQHSPRFAGQRRGELTTANSLVEMEMEKLLEDSVPCRVRAKRGCATHPRSIAERVRRTRISDRIRKLQELVPNMDKQTNTADMLEEAVEYVKTLQRQIQELTEQQKKCKCMPES
ncbi:transcription factor bHLH81-like isoform X2 [Silene latifolia]|uniref:transcription factor bHLH81-like isoform X2 n=1 Tax=Silene latifolia TaxID=37657 RepID=UPI003D78A43B